MILVYRIYRQNINSYQIQSAVPEISEVQVKVIYCYFCNKDSFQNAEAILDLPLRQAKQLFEGI